MRRKISTTVIALIALIITGLYINPSESRYVTAKVCSACHSGDSVNFVYEKWQASAHAKAYQTLKTQKAKDVAKKLGIGNPLESAKCLKCHVTNRSEGKHIDPEEGVSCEACHGPGSKYIMRDIMSDRKKSKEKGLKIPSNDPVFCKTCHNPESPTYKEFKFASAWEKIKHPKPVKK